MQTGFFFVYEEKASSYIELLNYNNYTLHILQLDSYPEKPDTGRCDEVFLSFYLFWNVST